jgi:hypothetical protein
MKERNLLRGPRLWKIAEFKIGDNVVRAIAPTKSYAAALAARQLMQATVVTINTRRYTRRRHPIAGPRGSCDPVTPAMIPKSDFSAPAEVCGNPRGDGNTTP